MKIAIVVGTRPEIIKTAVLMKKLGEECVVIHSNQHYSPEMDAVFFDELKLPKPKYNLNVGSGQHANQTGNIMIRMEPILEKEQPDLVLVQGDTNTVLAAALTASKLGIKVAHIEAGLRSYDRTMPEETNRVIVDHLSDYLFAVTDTQRKILEGEGIAADKIFVVGNSVIDCLSDSLSQDGPDKKHPNGGSPYFLLTLHRANNVDRPTALEQTILSINEISTRFDRPILFPVHPRTRSKLETATTKLNSNIRLMEPQKYGAFVNLMAQADLILTDSGGVQEEASYLKVPCVTLRENTERPETVEVGANVVVGTGLSSILSGIDKMLSTSRDWSCPYGDGTTSEQIIEVIKRTHGELDQSISVLGMGYMGLPMALVLAKAGFDVTGYDIDQKRIALLKEGQLPFEEHGLEEAFKAAETKISFENELPASDCYIISVPTPSKDGKCDLSYVESAFKKVLSVAEPQALVIVESTIKPGTCRDILAPIAKKEGKLIKLAHCPERAIPGETFRELVENDRIIGGLDKETTDRAFAIYQKFVKGELLKTDATTAECSKLMENTFRDVNIALANEMEQILHKLGVDFNEARELANRHPRVNIHQAGPGVGGHCIPIDPWFLIEDYPESQVILNARKLNEERPIVIAKRILAKMKENGWTKLGIHGVAFKPGVDDTRETPIEPLVDYLIEQGIEVRCSDPLVKEWKYPIFEHTEVRSWAELNFE